MLNARFDLMFFTFITLSLGLACSNADSDDDVDENDSSAVGGYTGLGTYTGVSGVYGSGGASNVGATGKGGATTTSTGGSTATKTDTGAGGASAAAGGASASSGGKTTAGGASTSLGGKTTAGGTSASGGTPATGGKTAAGGTSSGATFTWPGAYNPNGTAPVASGEHRPGTNCMTSSCHGPATGSRAFAFGGTLYQANGTTAAAHIQIAIVSGTKTYTTYSGTNGNFWLPLASASGIDWTAAAVHLRSAAGTSTKPSDAGVNASCNSCHGAGSRITAP
jgi:hypothetical protein